MCNKTWLRLQLTKRSLYDEFHIVNQQVKIIQAYTNNYGKQALFNFAKGDE